MSAAASDLFQLATGLVVTVTPAAPPLALQDAAIIRPVLVVALGAQGTSESSEAFEVAAT